MTISGIGKYQTFGLQPMWISKLIEHKEDIREKFGAGKPMISAAMAWFREAGVIGPNTDVNVTPLLSVAEKLGADHSLFWQIIWLRLVTCSSLVKWFICNTTIDSPTNKNELDEKLAQGVTSNATRDSGLNSLFALLKNAPFGTDTHPLVKLEMKGKTIKSLTRQSIDPDPLAVLYGLYLTASLAKRNSLTIREMQEAHFDMPCISPIVAFGLSRNSFVQMTNGLATKYPEFITAAFTHGLDEVRLFSEEKTVDDVIELVLDNG